MTTFESPNISGAAKVHLVLGSSAGGNVRAAMALDGTNGRVIVLDDDLCHGPLGDLRARGRYLEACLQHYGEPPILTPRAIENFEACLDELSDSSTLEVCIWAGENASERTFLGLICFNLQNFKGSITRIGAEGLKSVPYIGAQPPELLVDLFERRETVGPTQQSSLAQMYCSLRDTGCELRQWDAGGIRNISLDFYDDLLLSSCPQHWTPAARVVGEAMGLCEEHNLLGDVFLSGRLKHLVASNAVDVHGPQENLRTFKIRRK